MTRLRVCSVAIAAGIVLAIAAPSAGAASFSWIPGYNDPATPDQYDQVGILKEGSPAAKKILVLEPGTSASAAYFEPLVQDIVGRMPGWQVWSVERRENLLEDQSMVDLAKQGLATPEQLFHYYLGYLTDPSGAPHYTPVPDSAVPFARGWGMRVAVEDLRRVIKAAAKNGREVVLGGHSLGGSITTAYATWDFNGKPGANGLSGLVFIDGGSGPPTLTAATASQALGNLQKASPWLSFGGIPAPYAGLFNVVGSTLTKLTPDTPSLLQDWPLLPSSLSAPVRVTNEAGYGYALDTESSPPSLAAAQVHAGHLADSGDPRGWDPGGEITPIQRVADMFSGTGLLGLDGTAWYHPMRLSIDSGAVGGGVRNPAQSILGVKAIHGHDLNLPMYAFATALGGQRVIDAARLLAKRSHIRRKRLTLLNRSTTYAHVDPLAAYPQNDFVDGLVPFLKKARPLK